MKKAQRKQRDVGVVQPAASCDPPQVEQRESGSPVQFRIVLRQENSRGDRMDIEGLRFESIAALGIEGSSPLLADGFLYGREAKNLAAPEFLESLAKLMLVLAAAERKVGASAVRIPLTQPLSKTSTVGSTWIKLEAQKSQKIANLIRPTSPVWFDRYGPWAHAIASQPWRAILQDDGTSLFFRRLTKSCKPSDQPVLSISGPEGEFKDTDMLRLATRICPMPESPERHAALASLRETYPSPTEMYIELREWAYGPLKKIGAMPRVTIVDYAAMSAHIFIEALLNIGADVRALMVHPACTGTASRRAMSLLLEGCYMPVWMRNHKLHSDSQLSLWYYPEELATGFVIIEGLCSFHWSIGHTIAPPDLIDINKRVYQFVPWSYGNDVFLKSNADGNQKCESDFNERFGEICKRPPDCDLSEIRTMRSDDEQLYKFIQSTPTRRSKRPAEW